MRIHKNEQAALWCIQTADRLAAADLETLSLEQRQQPLARTLILGHAFDAVGKAAQAYGVKVGDVARALVRLTGVDVLPSAKFDCELKVG